MLPWIRGWGADCEVLEPKILRRALEREVMELMDRYGIKGDTSTISEDDDDAWAAALFGGGK
jgi:CRISPR-associated endonuclease/helicase Cas3